MATKHTRHCDFLSVPWMFGANYFLLFGLTAIDAIFDLGRSSIRARDVFISFHGVSALALAYVWLGYCMFLLGYYLPGGRVIANLIPKGFPFISRRSSFVSQRRFSICIMLLFSLTFPLMISHVQRFGVGGRIAGTEEFDPISSYNFAGDVSFIVYSLGVWQFMLSRRRGADKVPRGYTLFVWGCMFALETIFAIWIGSRTHVVRVLLVAVLAYHYGHRRIRGRVVLVGALVLIAFVVPLLALPRGGLKGGSPAPDSLQSVVAWGWDSIMKHYSSLESFTVTFERLDSAPQPDSLRMIILGGLVPRAIWPDKPFSTWGYEFSYWVTGYATDAYVATLPGELLLHFGYIGALIAMMVLGILWRTAFTALIRSENRPCRLGFIYIVLLSQALPQMEVGFVGPSSALLRTTVISLLVFFVVSTGRFTVTRTPANESHHSTRPVRGPLRKSDR